MQPSLSLSSDGSRLSGNLQAAAASAASLTAGSSERIHIAGMAGGIYAAYEKLRNAADYNEQHLLCRAAIERFLRRVVLFRGNAKNIGVELVTELTEAKYLKNDTVPIATAAYIDTFVAQYVKLAGVIETNQRVSHDKARRWTLQVLSVSIEKLLLPNPSIDAFIDFAYAHYLGALDRQSLATISDDIYQDALYIAVHRALLKSDTATIRFYLVARLAVGRQSAEHFVERCKRLDELFQHPATNQLFRLLSRNIAPMRILREVIIDEANPAAAISNRANLLAKVQVAAEEQYGLVHNKLIKGIVRAIAFVFITKIIVGLAVEVPFDLVAFQEVAWLPLVINLVFPTLYMWTARWSLAKPGAHNTDMIVSYVDKMLYQTGEPVRYRSGRRVAAQDLRIIFNVIYSLTYLISFGLAVFILGKLQFTFVHTAIFFTFFSAVSFLRFRLIQAAKELEIVDHRQGFVTTLADFFYTPFVRLGMWISDKYKQVNLITALLDFAIELPLKTSLRLLREWVGFMRDKREEL